MDDAFQMYLSTCDSGHTESTPVTSVVGDLTDAKQVRAAMEGVQCVIHTAGLVSIGTFPDEHAMHQVNVIGEKNPIHRTRESAVELIPDAFASQARPT